MLRFLTTLIVALMLLAANSPQARAQQTRAYAPENLRSLPHNDQVRVIDLEYAEQSGGRRIPDDQLRFYIDQVNRSNWGFSRIKQDIAQSLGGSGGGWNPGPQPGGSVVCESRDNRHHECATGFRGRAELVQNLSGTRCVEGQNWGSRSGSVWVDRGCRGRFEEGFGGGGGGGNGSVRCESKDSRYRECATGFRGRAVLSRQLSDQRCVEGRTWGQRGGMVWVDNGCRAEFSRAGGGGGWGPDPGAGYSVTCSSENGRRRTCAWNTRYGRPQLLEQLSGSSCREGSSWGYQGNLIWVDRGCRGRFGTDR